MLSHSRGLRALSALLPIFMAGCGGAMLPIDAATGDGAQDGGTINGGSTPKPSPTPSSNDDLPSLSNPTPSPSPGSSISGSPLPSAEPSATPAPTTEPTAAPDVMTRAVIDWEEALPVVVSAADVSDWQPSEGRAIHSVASSADGAMAAFTVGVCGALSETASCWRLYVYDVAAGTLTDLTEGIPEDALGGVHYLKMNADGSRVFFRTPRFGDVHDVYYCDTTTGACGVAVENMSGDGGHHPYAINADGTRVWFLHNNGYNEVTEKYDRGIFYCDVGGAKVQLFDLADLPDPGATWMNMINPLGVSGDGSAVLFSWNEDYWAGNSVGFYVADGAGPHRATDDLFPYVYAAQDMPSNIVTDDGALALLGWQGDGEYLDLVELATGERDTLAEGNLDFSNSCLSGDGQWARFGGLGGSLVVQNVATGERRDARSYHTPLSTWPTVVSNLSTDGRYQYAITESTLYRLDMSPNAASYFDAPRIAEIRFGAADIGTGQTVIVEVEVDDPQDAADVLWVKFHSLVGGIEYPTGVTGDPVQLTDNLRDDGEGDDAVAGDGVYTSRLRTASSTFYEGVTYPVAAGMRFVAADTAGNYAIADTTIHVNE